MKFFAESAIELGDRKIETYFAIWPITIGLETRWLETVSVLYEYASLWETNYDGKYRYIDWVPINFVDKT